MKRIPFLILLLAFFSALLPQSNSTQGFAGESKKGHKLLEEFKRTFP